MTRHVVGRLGKCNERATYVDIVKRMKLVGVEKLASMIAGIDNPLLQEEARKLSRAKWVS